MSKRSFIITSIVAALLLAVLWKLPRSSQESNPLPLTSEESNSSLLTITPCDHYWQADIRDPWKQGRTLHRYILVDRKDSAQVKDLPDGTVVYVPIERSGVFTTAHCQLLCWLGAQDAITGVCDKKYIHIPIVQQTAVDCGDGMLPSIERIVELQPQALLVSPFENSGGFGPLEKIGIPIIETADYMETSSLGRAEWMRFYGLLYGRQRQADSLYHVVDSTYHALCRQAAAMPQGRSVLTERKTGSTWYVPGGQSTIGTMLADAHAAYAFAADNHSGSLPLSVEEVLDKAGQSDLWLIKNSTGKSITRNDLLAEYHGYKMLKAFRKGDVYVCNTSERPYFEEVSFRPDYLLRELILLSHPECLQNDTLRYYERME